MMARFTAVLSEELGAARKFLTSIDKAKILLVFLFCLACIVWFLLGEKYPAATFASPYETFEALYWMLADRHNEYIVGIGETLSVFFRGFLGAVVAGLSLTLVMGLSPLLGRALNPLLDLLGSVPNIAFMPMVVALMGLDQPAKVTIVFLGAVLPVAINGHAALRQIDGDYEEAALDLGATRLRALLAVVWPLALPQMVAGMRVGAGYALAACVVAEIYTAMTGLGGLLVGYGNSFNMPRYFVIVITLALIGIFTTALLRYVETFFARRAGLISERE